MNEEFTTKTINLKTDKAKTYKEYKSSTLINMEITSWSVQDDGVIITVTTNMGPYISQNNNMFVPKEFINEIHDKLIDEIKSNGD